jgi:hypothetical protein
MRRLRDPEDESGNDGEVEAGDHQHVKGAGALKADAQGVGKVSAVAGDHGGEHDGVVLSEAEGRGQAAHGGGQGEQARAGGMLEGGDAAGKKAAWGDAEAVYPVDAHRSAGSDALLEKKIFAAPDAWIVVDLRLEQANDGADAIAAMERLGNGLGRRGFGPADGQADCARDGALRVLTVGDDFECGDTQINSLCGALRGQRCGGFAGIGQALLDFAAQWASIENSSLNCAQQAVRERRDRRRGGGLGLHPCAPCAQQKPKYGQRQPGDALRAECDKTTERSDERHSNENQAGAHPEPVCGGDTSGKEPCGMEEGD